MFWFLIAEISLSVKHSFLEKTILNVWDIIYRGLDFYLTYTMYNMILLVYLSLLEFSWCSRYMGFLLFYFNFKIKGNT